MSLYAQKGLIKRFSPLAHAKRFVWTPSLGTPLAERVASQVRDLIASGRATGLQVCVYRKGVSLVDAAGGTLGELDPRAVKSSTLFPLMDLSHVPAVLAIHGLVRDGQLTLDDPVCKHWPEFGANGKEGVSVGDLLCHSAGLHGCVSRTANVKALGDLDAMLAKIVAAEGTPGERVTTFCT